jgi:hypothetical protein
MRFLFIIAISLSSFSSLAQGEWIPYKSVEGEFSILTKGLFKQAIFHADTEIGKIEMRSYAFPSEPKPKDVVYTIMFYDFPKGSIHSDSTNLAKDFFQETVSSSAESVNGTLVYQSDIDIKGYKGKHWRINYEDGKKSIASRVYLVKNRCYILNVINPDASKSGSDANHYFNSFRLLGK